MFNIMDVREGNFSKKNLLSQGDRWRITITEDSSSYPFLMLVFSNKFIFDDEREASLREIALFIKTRQDSPIRRKVTRKRR